MRFKINPAAASIRAAILPHSSCSADALRCMQKKLIGRMSMAKLDFGSLPQGNPCAQCGKPIATPEWIESGPRRTSYLWHCWACDYQFEAVAFFEEEDSEALAA
jgi:hypothetical protein